jgi:hypothetical protein
MDLTASPVAIICIEDALDALIKRLRPMEEGYERQSGFRHGQISAPNQVDFRQRPHPTEGRVLRIVRRDCREGLCS